MDELHVGAEVVSSFERNRGTRGVIELKAENRYDVWWVRWDEPSRKEGVRYREDGLTDFAGTFLKVVAPLVPRIDTNAAQAWQRFTSKEAQYV